MDDSFPLALHLSNVQMWMPRPIQALATHPDGKVVAVGREHGDIELVVPSEGYRARMRIPGQEGKRLRSLVWLKVEDDGEQEQAELPRLFGCGLDGTIFEVDLLKLCYTNVRDVNGGAAWCMRAIHSLSLLAVGCEDGAVRFFSTEASRLEYKRSLPSTGSRVLSLALGPNDDMLFAGCANSLIHCFKVTSGQSLFDMRFSSVGRRATLVWSLEALSDGTLISGDSAGRVQKSAIQLDTDDWTIREVARTGHAVELDVENDLFPGVNAVRNQKRHIYLGKTLFGYTCGGVECTGSQVWDGLTGTELQSLTTHGADIMALCMTEDETEVFASGCDGKVVLLERTHVSQGPRKLAADAGSDGPSAEARRVRVSRRQRQGWEWSVSCMHRLHTHDVYALAIHRRSLEGTPCGEKGAARRGPILVSGGLDASLGLYPVPTFREQGPRQIQPLPSRAVAALSPTPRLVMVMHEVHIDIWEIPKMKKGSLVEVLKDGEQQQQKKQQQKKKKKKKKLQLREGEKEEQEDGREELEEGNLKTGDHSPGPRLRLRLKPKLEDKKHLSCAALSSDGGLLAVSNTRSTRLYRLSRGSASDGPLSAKRLRLPGNCAPAANALAFSRDSRRLVLAAAAGDIRVVELPCDGGAQQQTVEEGVPAAAPAGEAKLVHCFEELADEVSERPAGEKQPEVSLPLPVSTVSLSACGKWMAAASVSGVVNVFNLSRLRHHWTVSGHRYVGMRFCDDKPVLVVVDSSSQFRLLEVAKKRLAEYHKDARLPKVPAGRGPWGGKGDVPALAGIAFNPDDESRTMVLFNHRCIMNVTPVRQIPSKVFSTSFTGKKRKLDGEGEAEQVNQDVVPRSSQSNFHAVTDFDSIVLLDFLAKNELLLLQNPSESIRQRLPSVLDRKQYGIS